jgi:putative membrane protein
MANTTDSGLKHYSIVALKGIGMGAANVVPGVSGGTIALMTGIFGELIDSLNTLMSTTSWKMLFKGQVREFWKYIHGNFMTALLIGVIISILSLAKLTTFLLVHNPVQIWAFFFGLIIASSVIMLADIKGWKFMDVVYTIIGIVLGYIVCTLSPTTTTDAYWFIFVCGAVAICTMILPGISGSFILLVMGKYYYIMQALSDLNIPVLLVFAVGAVIGLLAFSKFLHWLLKRAERPTMLVLIGFVIGSLIKVWPWYDKAALIKADGLDPTMPIPMSAMHIPGAIIWCTVGIVFVAALEMMGKKVSKDKTSE